MGTPWTLPRVSQGLLRGGVNGRAYTLDFETGRRWALNEQVNLTPRLWVVGSRVSVDRFTDTVNARIEVADTDRILMGLGVPGRHHTALGDGELTLRGSVDYERIVSGATTTTTVSGEVLRAEATENSLLVGLNGVYGQGRFTFGAEVSTRQELGSSDTEYVGFLNLGVRF